MSGLPSGTVTFVMTDVEGSTALWDRHGAAMDQAMDVLDGDLCAAVADHDGVVMRARGEGDSHFAVFPAASAAVLAMVELQRTRSALPWPKVRVAIHTAEARPRNGDYLGATVNRVARVRSAAHGGQIVCTRAVVELAGHLAALRFHPLGAHRLRDAPAPVDVFQVCAPGIAGDFPPLVTVENNATPMMAVVVVDQLESMHRVQLGDGPAHWQRPLFRRLRAAATEHDGRFLKLMGDGCLVAFDDPRTALRFARQLCSSTSSRLRAAVTAGLVDVVEGELSGRVVFDAFLHIRDVEAGHVWVSPVVEALVERPALVQAP